MPMPPDALARLSLLADVMLHFEFAEHEIPSSSSRDDSEAAFAWQGAFRGLHALDPFCPLAFPSQTNSKPRFANSPSPR